MHEPPKFRCCYCGVTVVDRDDLPRHEAKCPMKDVKKELWRLMIEIAHAREKHDDNVTRGRTR